MTTEALDWLKIISLINSILSIQMVSFQSFRVVHLFKTSMILKHKSGTPRPLLKIITFKTIKLARKEEVSLTIVNKFVNKFVKMFRKQCPIFMAAYANVSEGMSKFWGSYASKNTKHSAAGAPKSVYRVRPGLIKV